MTPRSPRRGYTLVEVLVAMVIFLILMVPLGWMTVQTANGKARARRIDDAVALSREDWGLVRRTPAAVVRDTTYARVLGEHAYTLERAVDTAIADTTLSGPALQAVPRARTWTAVRTCVVSPEATAGSDTVRCFAWRLPRVRMQP